MTEAEHLWFASPQKPIDTPPSLDVLGVPVHVAPDLQTIVKIVTYCLNAERRLLVTFVNPSSVSFAEQEPVFRNMLKRFDLVLPDGQGLVAAVNLLHKTKAARVSFDTTSLAPPVFNLAVLGNHTVCFVGGKPGVSERAKVQIEESFPGIKIIAALDGYGDANVKARQVRELDPDIVVVAMGWRSQEAFLLEMAKLGWRGAGFTCGGYFDQLAGGLRYYPAWVDRTNLRWLYRLMREPRRLWRRYVFEYGRAGVRLGAELLSRRLSMTDERALDPLEAARVARDPQRLAALRKADLLDTSAEESFDQLARLAARITNAPMALVSLVDAERQFFKACFGSLGAAPFGAETPLSHSFCQYAVAAKEPLVIEDARDHPVLRLSPAVTEHGLIAYAGIPLITPEDQALGTVCVLDSKPRPWSAEEIDSLKAITAAVAAQVSQRSAERRTEATQVAPAGLAESVTRYVQALDAYDDAIAGDPTSLEFLKTEAELQSRVVRTRAELHKIVDHISTDSLLVAAVKQHLAAEQQRAAASQAFATLSLGLRDVEKAVASARAAETELRAQWRTSQKSPE